MRQCWGLRSAHGRRRSRRRATAQGTPRRGGSCNRPCALRYKDATDHRSGNGAAFPAQQHDQLVLAPTGEALPIMQHPFHQLAAPTGPPHLMRPMRTILQLARILRIPTTLPPIERLPADPEITAGTGHVAVLPVVAHPTQSLLGGAADFHPGTRHGTGSRNHRAYLHRDTVQVSRIILNEDTSRARIVRRVAGNRRERTLTVQTFAPRSEQPQRRGRFVLTVWSQTIYYQCRAETLVEHQLQS